MLRALDDLVRQGKVLYTACSNYETWRLMEALWISDSNGWARFDGYQPQYSLVVRDIDEEIVPACEAKGLGVVAWSPLASGYLAGKYTPGSLKVDGTRSAEGWGFQTPLLLAQPRRHPADAARHRPRARPFAGPDRAALGDGPARHHQRHRRRPQCTAARRDAGSGRLETAGGSTRPARQGVGPGAQVSARLRGFDGRAAQ